MSANDHLSNSNLPVLGAPSHHELSPPVKAFWRLVQVVTWALGMFIWVALIVKPELGLHLLWNVLIPVAPALLVIAPGIWRNVCPLGSMSVAPNHFGLSKRKRLSPTWRARLYLGAFVLLLVVVPLRKVLLDTNGPVLAAVLGVVGLLAIGMGVIFSWKSGWCSSLCPVYPVELLYGSRPLVSVPNAHCSSCLNCVAPCSEASKSLTPQTAVNTKLGTFVGTAFVGCFPGFVWGWYNVPKFSGWEGFSNLHVAYGIPFAAGGLTLLIYLALRQALPKQAGLIASVFAAAAIITYYWFRLPPVFGIGPPGSAMIVDISQWLPTWSTAALRIATVVVFGWLLVGRTNTRRSWESPPPMAQKVGTSQPSVPHTVS